jgi:hypothetical protein
MSGPVSKSGKIEIISHEDLRESYAFVAQYRFNSAIFFPKLYRQLADLQGDIGYWSTWACN